MLKRNTPLSPTMAQRFPQLAKGAAPAAAPPSDLSNAIGQLKAGDNFSAQNSLRKSVGLPEVAATPAGTPATLSNAINTLKTGNKAGATDMLRSIVGLPSSAPIAAPAKTGTPAPVKPTPVVTSSPLKPNPVVTPAPAAAPQKFGNGLARFSAKQPGMKSGGKVSASSRGDGIAQRGKTRGKCI